MRSMWDLWLFGVVNDKIAPYRMLQGFDLSGKGDSVLLTKAKIVMEKLETIARERDPSLHLRHLNVTDSRLVFASAFNALSIAISGNSAIDVVDRRHYGETSYLTMYDLINKLKKRTISQVLGNV